MIVALARKLLVIGDPSQECRQRRNLQYSCASVLPSVCRMQDHALGHSAIADEVPQGDLEVAVSRTHTWLQCRHTEWVRRLGAVAAMRITASWFGSLHPPHTSMWHGSSCTHAGLPSNVRHPDLSNCAVVLGAIKAKPIGGRQRRPAIDRSCARRQLDVWVGTKKRFARSNKETARSNTESVGTRNWIGPLGNHLDKNLPIQV